MTPVSFADITYAQGLQLLELRKQALDAGQIRRMTPEALANTFVLRDTGAAFVEKAADDGLIEQLKSGIKGLGQQAREGWGNLDEPTKNVLKSTAIGGGIGAGAGLGKALLSGEDSLGRNLLRGGAAGAAIGGGLGLGMNTDAIDNTYDRIRRLYEQHAKKTEAPASATSASASTASTTTPEEKYREIQEKFPTMTPTQQSEKQQKLETRANTNAPETQLGVTAGVLGGGTGLGVRWASKGKTYSPAKLSRGTQSQLGGLDLAKPKTQAQFNHLNAMMQRPPGDIATNASLLNNNAQTAKELEEQLTKSRGWWSKLTGKAPAHVVENIHEVLPGAGDKAMDMAMKPHMGRRLGLVGAGLGAVKGLADYFGVDPLSNYNRGNLDREQARQTLDALGLLPPK